MEDLPPLQEAESRVFADTRDILEQVRKLVAQEPRCVAEGMSLLLKMRQTVYESLNQVQHEYLVVRAAGWIREKRQIGGACRWRWNPRQQGDRSEPDLAVFLGEQQTVSAEVTTSERPQGTIDQRMAHTLLKLSGMPGEKFYFVRTEEMRLRAETKVRTAGYAVEVVRLP